MDRIKSGPRNGRRINGKNGKKKRVMDLDLRAAALNSPLLRESWSDGSPLNWLEFITGCKMGDPQDGQREPGAGSSAHLGAQRDGIREG